MNATETLYKFILDSGGQLEAGTVERWFTMIRQAIISANGSPVTPEDAFERLTEGMAGALYRNNGITSPKLLEAIRENLREYLDEMEEAKPEAFHPVRAKNIVLPNTLLAQTLPALINRGETDIVTGPRKSTEPLKETVDATFLLSDSDGITIEGEYTLFHESVFFDFLSLALAGNTAITAAMIRRQQSQNFEANINPETIREYENTVEELERVKIKIDIKDEAERRGWDLSKVEDFRYGRMMLVLDTFELTTGGETVKAYSLRETPLLYEHALLSNQLISFPARLRVVENHAKGTKYRCTKKRVEIQTYLIRQIRNMKADLESARKSYNKNESRRKKDPAGRKERPLSYYRKMSPNILFDTVFEKTGLSGSQNKVLLDYKSYIKDCLEDWHDAGEIKGFTPLHDGKRKDVETGVRILLD